MLNGIIKAFYEYLPLHVPLNLRCMETTPNSTLKVIDGGILGYVNGTVGIAAVFQFECTFQDCQIFLLSVFTRLIWRQSNVPLQLSIGSSAHLTGGITASIMILEEI